MKLIFVIFWIKLWTGPGSLTGDPAHRPGRPISAHPGISGPFSQAKFLGRAGPRLAGPGRILVLGRAATSPGRAGPPDLDFRATLHHPCFRITLQRKHIEFTNRWDVWELYRGYCARGPVLRVVYGRPACGKIPPIWEIRRQLQEVVPYRPKPFIVDKKT